MTLTLAPNYDIIYAHKSKLLRGGFRMVTTEVWDISSAVDNLRQPQHANAAWNWLVKNHINPIVHEVGCPTEVYTSQLMGSLWSELRQGDWQASAQSFPDWCRLRMRRLWAGSKHENMIAQKAYQHRQDLETYALDKVADNWLNESAHASHPGFHELADRFRAMSQTSAYLGTHAAWQGGRVHYHGVYLLEMRRLLIVRLGQYQWDRMSYFQGKQIYALVEEWLPWEPQQANQDLRDERSRLGEIWATLKRVKQDCNIRFKGDYLGHIIQSNSKILGIGRDLWYQWVCRMYKREQQAFAQLPQFTAVRQFLLGPTFVR